MNRISKTILTVVVLLLLAGCQTRPIATQAEIGGDIPIHYKSEKDITIEREKYDPATGNLIERTRVQSVASAPALAQAEREKIEAETTTAAIGLAAKVLESAKPVP